MPELPEVETALRDLEPLLRGRTIVAARIFWPGVVATPDVDGFCARIAGMRFEHFDRRGKYLIFGLAARDAVSAGSLVVHQRMTGRLSLLPGDVPRDERHTHAVLTLDSGQNLHYRDPRKFGRLWLVDDAAAVIGRLGPEPGDPAFSAVWLAGKLAGRTAVIKALLLDQSIFAGVGNIYADEALYAARIHPARAGGSLTGDEIARLRDAVRVVLEDAVGRGGSSLGSSSTNYARPNGDAGGYQEAHRVFQRTGQPCYVCGTPIARTVIAQRSTHFCPRCQTASKE